MDKRSHLFKDLIRRNLLDVLQPIKFFTLLYKARGFLSFCLLRCLNFSPNRAASLSGEEGFPRTTAVPQQQCNQRAAALQAARDLLTCSTADAGREESQPLSHLISRTSPSLLTQHICTTLKRTAGHPERSRVWSPIPSRD